MTCKEILPIEKLTKGLKFTVMSKLLTRIGFLIAMQLLFALSCGVLFLKPKRSSLINLNAMFAGWILMSNQNLSNQIILDKNLTTLREGEEITLNVTLSQFAGNGKIYFKSDNTSIQFNGADNTSLQFTKENISAPQKLILSVKEDENSINERSTIEVGGESYAVLILPVEVKDNDSQRIMVYNASATLEEGKTSTFRARLNTKPANSVTVTLSPSDSSSLQTDKSTLTFTPENYSTEQTVSLIAPEDSDSTSETSVINLSMTGADNETLSVKVLDNDIKPVFSLPSVSVNEGLTTTVTVQLNGEPGSDVSVLLNSSIPSSVTVSPSSLNFTTANWNTPQIITLNALQDTNYNSESVNITAAGSGITANALLVTAVDDEVQSVVFTGPTQVIEGQSITLGVSITIAPAFNTTVTFSLNSSILQMSPATVTFTPANYNFPQNITITAIANDGNENSEKVVLTASASSMANSIYNILVIDKDTRILLSNFTIPITEGQAGSMQVTLSGNPIITNTVNLSSSWVLVTLGNTLLSFDSTNWNIPQTVTLTALDDANFLLDQSTITGSGTNLNTATYTLDIKDKDIGMLNGAVAYYPFNANANDESGNGNHGTPNGATLTTNRYGYKDRAYSFDGNDKITTITSSLNFGTGGFYIGTWIKTSQAGTWPRFLIKRANTVAGSWYSLNLYNNKFRFEIAAGVQFDSIQSVNDDKWRYISIRRDVALGKYSMFINGILDNEMVNDGRNLDTFAGSPVEMGTWVNTEFLNGKLDDIRMYNRALSDAEVLAVYNDTTEVRPSCKQILADGLSVGDGIYTIDPDGAGFGTAPFEAYCDMTTSGGGWTLALKANGNLNTFEYNSAYWTDSNLYPSTALTDTPDLSQSEYKGQAFTNLGFSELLLRFDTGGVIQNLPLTIVTQTSMQTMFNGGFVATSVGRAAWKGLVPNSSLQWNCNLEGINNVTSYMNARIGIIGNEQGDCSSTDSSIGLGLFSSDISDGILPSFGNYADIYGPDNGSARIPSFAYVFVR